ncbi:MAG TPA: hypothetical protein DIU39_04300 [Flavobacteriales bacterium]|nr:hypothetical protein [Flavobacteriales bacterium]|tara:strand:+ start:7568 stop:8068 length:501 start_codon:yes stop_codon:yes gene_type:complete
MKTKIILLTTFALSFGFCTIAQTTLERSVISSAGNYSEQSSVWLSYTVGEPVVFTGNGNSVILTQGFQQPTDNEEAEIYIYSGFTPNGDGDNDEWYIDYIYLYPDNKVAIFDRWGVLVWKADGYNNKDVVWKGDNNVTGDKLSNGTYFYVIKVNDKTYKGWVELNR